MRPKGSKNKVSQGLPLEKRLKVLQKIILDDTQKTCDRLQAVKTMTELMNDKVKTAQGENPITTLKFTDNIETKPLIPDNKQDNLLKNIETKDITTTTTTITNHIQPIDNKDVMTEGLIFNYIPTEEKGDTLDE